MGRIIMHLDMDAFYASVEIKDQPEYANVPLVIGGDPKRGRGVVSTANYIARTYGIHSAMPVRTALRLCPHAHFVRPNFTKYQEASKQVMQILRRYSECVEQVGMDEAYLDVTNQCDQDWLAAHALALSIRAAVQRELGLGCSIGIAPNKASAKIASDQRKPRGITVVTPDELLSFLRPLPVRLINGCGPKSAAKLAEWDVHTIQDLQEADPHFLASRFGKQGIWLHQVANGIDPREVRAQREAAKSHSNERTFARDATDDEEVRDTARHLLAGLMQQLRGKRSFQTITIKHRDHKFNTISRAHTLQTPVEPQDPANQRYAQSVLENLLQALPLERPTRLIGVKLSGFHERTGQIALDRFGMVAVSS